jgi:hypothetical protein
MRPKERFHQHLARVSDDTRDTRDTRTSEAAATESVLSIYVSPRLSGFRHTCPIISSLPHHKGNLWTPGLYLHLFGRGRIIFDGKHDVFLDR